MNNTDHLKFPTRRSVARVKQDAKILKKEQDISHREALNKAARENGLDMDWQQAMTHLKAKSESLPYKLSTLLNSDWEGNDSLTISAQELADKLIKHSSLGGRHPDLLKKLGGVESVSVSNSLMLEGSEYVLNNNDLNILRFINDYTADLNDGISEYLYIIVGNSSLELHPAYLIFPKKLTKDLSAFKSVRSSFERLAKLSISTVSNIPDMNWNRPMFRSFKFDTIKSGPSFTVEIDVAMDERLYCNNILMSYDKSKYN